MTTGFNEVFQHGMAPNCVRPSSNTGRAWERSDWPLELEESRCISEAAWSIARRGKIYKQMRQSSSKTGMTMRRYQREQIRTQRSKLNGKGKGVQSFPPITPPLFHPGTGCQIPGRKKLAAGSNRKHIGFHSFYRCTSSGRLVDKESLGLCKTT